MKITDTIKYVGVNDHQVDLFEGQYKVPNGMSYNSYVILDEKIAVMDTVDANFTHEWLDNIQQVLGDRKPDYLIVQHMEPDHSATIRTLLMLYPEAEVVCSKKTEGMLRQFFGDAVKMNIKVVGEGDTLKTGKHEFTFLAAPMVHWPEVIVTYDLTTKTLFSADAFGTFGALNGALFADEVDFFRDYLDEARRYYTNIVGKYGVQVQALLKKAATVEIQTICPLHGFVWRENIGAYLEKYQKWSLYEPEVSGVMIAYASVYGNTENAANILACKLRDKGIKTTMFDVSVAETSEVVAASFQYSHLVFAAPTYNGGIFIKMDEVLRDIEAHSLKNRTVAFMENGTWAVTCGKQMKEIFAGLKGMNIIEDTVTIKSALADGQEAQIEKLAEAISETM